MIDQILGQTRTKSMHITDDGPHIVINPGRDAIAMGSMLITINKREGEVKTFNEQDFKLILQIGDDANRHEIARIDTDNTSVLSHQFQGFPKFWRGGRLELLKNFEGTVTISVSYLNLSGQDYSAWIWR